jgi:hypothetical protein
MVQELELFELPQISKSSTTDQDVSQKLELPDISQPSTHQERRQSESISTLNQRTVLHVPKNESDLSDSDFKSLEIPTSLVKVEENVIAPPDTVNDLNEKKIKETKWYNTTYCVVSQCPTKGGAMLHTFPRNPYIRAKWLKICQLSTVKQQHRVCQRHFNKSDYRTDPDTFNDLNEKFRRARLNIGTLPSLHLPIQRKLYKQTYCVVPQCPTKSGVMSHAFPTNPDLRAKWLNICQLSTVKNQRVCQSHFNKSDYKTDPGTINDLNEKRRARLKFGAFPVLNVPRNESTKDLSDSDLSLEIPTSLVKVEEIVIAPPDTVSDLNEKERNLSYTAYCAVPQCTSKAGAKSHNFPTNPDLRAKWLNICKLSKLSTVKWQNRVCQRHFNKSDYKTDPGTFNDLNEKRRARLKGGALPVLHLPKNESTSLEIPTSVVKVGKEFDTGQVNSSIYFPKVIVPPDTVSDLNEKKRKPRKLYYTMYCSVPQCTTKRGATSHTFPTNPDLRAKWQKICQLSTVKQHNRVCQRHFNKSDYFYAPGTFNDLNETIRKARLNKGAFPSLHVPNNESKNSESKNESTNSNSTLRMNPLPFDVNVEKNLSVITPDKINDFFEKKIRPRLLSSTLKIPSDRSSHPVLKSKLFRCSVPQCRTHAPNSHGHTFPTNPDRMAKWQNICQLSKVKSSDRVCQLHFEQSDYLNAFNFNVLNEDKPLKLNIEACPSLHMPQNESTNDLCDSSSELTPFDVVNVEENDIAPPDTINVFNEDIKPSLKIGAFPVVLHVPNDSTNDLSVDCDSSMDPLAVTVKVEN